MRAAIHDGEQRHGAAFDRQRLGPDEYLDRTRDAHGSPGRRLRIGSDAGSAPEAALQHQPRAP